MDYIYCKIFDCYIPNNINKILTLDDKYILLKKLKNRRCKCYRDRCKCPPIYDKYYIENYHDNLCYYENNKWYYKYTTELTDYWYYSEADCYIHNSIKSILAIDKINHINNDLTQTDINTYKIDPFTIEEYHNIFCEFINNKWIYIKTDINQNQCKYCLQNKKILNTYQTKPPRIVYKCTNFKCVLNI